MKKLYLFIIFSSIYSNIATAQVVDHAVGLLFGAGSSLGTEISYQHGLTSNNRLEVDLGFTSSYKYVNNFRQDYNSWALTGIYHWVWKLKFDDNLNWYAGPGARIGTWSHNLGYDYAYNNGLFVAAAGDVGLEYSFQQGIQLALNARPEIGLINHGSGLNIGFAVRYQFK